VLAHDASITVNMSRGLQCGPRWLDLSVPCVMGVLNVTPDSFSDGGALSADAAAAPFLVSLNKALDMAGQMIRAGARIIDVGGESTRPGAAAVSEQEELDRVIPVVEAICREFDVIVSVDTSTPAVITESAAAGAGMINDIRALQRPGAMGAAVAAKLAVCLMHMQGEPATMQLAPAYADVVAEVREFLRARADAALAAGMTADRICIDPGFGFGKSLQNNYSLLAELSVFNQYGWPVLVGMSRKSMIGLVIDKPVESRLAGSLAAAMVALMAGADIIRTHDVAETVDVLKVFSAVRSRQQG
jgi:dihydropteroate synthase